jgi:phage terminase small subunit
MSESSPLYAVAREREALPTAPRSLKATGKALWVTVVTDLELEPYQLATLRLACECLDRIDAARLAIQEHGLVIAGRFGLKSNPACDLETKNKVVYARLMREIGLDALEMDAARPKPLYSGRRR